jgi:hypothetical protein
MRDSAGVRDGGRIVSLRRVAAWRGVLRSAVGEYVVSPREALRLLLATCYDPSEGQRLTPRANSPRQGVLASGFCRECVPPFGRGPCCLEYVTCLNDSGRLSRCTMRARRAELRQPRPVRLVAQDSALSRRRQGFDSPTGYFRRGILARGGCAHEGASAWHAHRRNRALAPRGR